ncbi:MAG: hypothetical protein EP346_11200 [Bacteroidetes bacterium]|nr:MAG: hypothetical protein EP346_11200 [Bacteroidota bacterium]
MRIHKFVLIISLMLSTTLWSQEELIGTWLVERVQVGENTMTPDARWSTFHADGTHEGGNGWKKHSEGTYQFTEGQLTIETTNGVDDEFGAFQVMFTEDGNMTWEREEEGMTVVVHLVKVESVPPTEGDKLLGLWELSSVNGEAYDGDRYTLFMRWDNVYKITDGDEVHMGTYRIHPHRQRVEWVEYGDNMPREFSTFKVEGDTLELYVESNGETVKYSYTRSHKL